MWSASYKGQWNTGVNDFYMLLRAKSMIDPNLSVSLSRFVKAPRSGWKEELQRSGYKYIKAGDTRTKSEPKNAEEEAKGSRSRGYG